MSPLIILCALGVLVAFALPPLFLLLGWSRKM